MKLKLLSFSLDIPDDNSIPKMTQMNYITSSCMKSLVSHATKMYFDNNYGNKQCNAEGMLTVISVGL